MEGGLQKEFKMITNKIYAAIPARSGSKTIPDKNIQIVNKLPLIAYSILTAKSIPKIDRIIVSTDSISYKEIAEKYGAEVPFLRPKAISGDDSCDIEWVNHLLHWLEKNEGQLPKYLIHLRPTSPLRESKYIELAIQYIEKHPKATALRSVIKMTKSAYKDFEIKNGFLRQVGSNSFDVDKANRPRHFYSTTYDANGYVDILKTEYILSTNMTKIHGNKVLAFKVPYIDDIDEEKELEKIRNFRSYYEYARF